MFSPPTEKKLSELLSRFPHRRSALLPALHLAQKETGFISDDVVVYLAEKFDLSPAQVFETVTFYNMFYTKPVGQSVIQVCTNVSCMLRGGEKLLNYLRDRLGIEVGETTADGRFTLLEVECLASCDTAPVIQLNDDYLENMDQEKLVALIKGLSSAP